VFEVSVAYKERVDHVMAVLKKLADDLRQEEAYRLLITGEPVMLGVDSLANSAVVIKFYIQTRPLQQWVVKREMLRRIKNEFDRIGIEIPFPHLMIYQGAAKPLEAPAEDAERWGRRDVA
jgi:small conductance mechanosensitive channel